MPMFTIAMHACWLPLQQVVFTIAMHVYWQWGWMLQCRPWYSWMLWYQWHAAHIVALGWFCCVHLYTVEHSCMQAQWSLQNLKLIILDSKCVHFCAMIFTKTSAYWELPLLPWGHAQVVKPSQPTITIVKKSNKVSSNRAGRQVVTMLEETLN